MGQASFNLARRHPERSRSSGGVKDLACIISAFRVDVRLCPLQLPNTSSPSMVIKSKRPPRFTKENDLADKPQTPDEKLQHEFNRWAAEGEGEKMERHHLDITEKAIRLMNLRPGERVLDLGCGSGWATRLLARLVGDGPEGFGQVVGVDVSDEMVRQARQASKDFENILYVWGSAQQIPWEENFFDKVLSVESFYYYPDQDRALMELFRVMAPRGRLFILINLYKDNQYSLQWVDKLKVPVHVRSAAEYMELLKKHAFENVEACRIPDDTPTPEDYKTKSFNSLDDLRAFKREGALLLMATKPDLRTPAPGYTIY
jgi:ubiquinone/menaquinone biosynthesis C-methylase UbiE